jgi:prepilin-type N-terminal cleavage/methylation domain-containing protein
MINRQQGFTLLEVMAALAIFSMLSVLAFMIFSQASELHQRSQKEIQQFNQLQRTLSPHFKYFAIQRRPSAGWDEFVHRKPQQP